jgi:hypothetical protein
MLGTRIFLISFTPFSELFGDHNPEDGSLHVFHGSEQILFQSLIRCISSVFQCKVYFFFVLVSIKTGFIVHMQL